MATLNSEAQVKRAIKLLQKHSAPLVLIDLFEELVEINKGCEYKAEIRELLLDACKRFNFNSPFSKDGTVRHFRARLIDSNNPGYAADCRETNKSKPNLQSEQSYRRGYDQGFSEALRLIEQKQPISSIQARAKEIRAWRTCPLQVVGSPPGANDQLSFSILLGRGNISPRLRYKVFERDNWRCQICGRTQASGVELHVDHRISVADGGGDDITNLQALCVECNLGKSSSSM